MEQKKETERSEETRGEQGEKEVKKETEEEEIERVLNDRAEKRLKIRMPVENIIDILQDEEVLIITPLTKDKNRIESMIHGEKGGTVVVKRVIETINAVKSKEVQDNTTVVVNNFGIIKEMGLAEELMGELGENRRIIVSIEGNKEEELLREYRTVSKKMVKKEFVVEGRTQLQRMGMIFSLTKVRPIKDMCIVVAYKKEERRVHVFLDAFGVRTEVNPKEKRDGIVGIFNTAEGVSRKLLEQYSLIVDNTGEDDSDLLREIRVGVLKIVTHGKTVKREDARFKKLLEQGMKYKYRIEGVLRLITRNVLSRKDEIDERVVKHLKGPLRML